MYSRPLESQTVSCTGVDKLQPWARSGQSPVFVSAAPLRRGGAREFKCYLWLPFAPSGGSRVVATDCVVCKA